MSVKVEEVIPHESERKLSEIEFLNADNEIENCKDFMSDLKPAFDEIENLQELWNEALNKVSHHVDCSKCGD